MGRGTRLCELSIGRPHLPSPPAAVPPPRAGEDPMTDFLLELRSEEIPARMQAGARADLEKLFRERARRGRRHARRDHRLVDPAPPRADRPRPARRDRSRPRGNQGPAHHRARAGARRLPAQDRPDAGPARGPRRRLLRGGRKAGQGGQGRARRGHPRDRPRLPLAQVDALGRRLARHRQPALGPPALGHRRDLRRGPRRVRPSARSPPAT